MGSEDPIWIHVDADLKEFIPQFMDNRWEELQILQKALIEGDFKTMANVAHNLKGVGSGFGFDEISSLGKQMEQQSLNQDTEGLEMTLKELERYLERVRIAE